MVEASFIELPWCFRVQTNEYLGEEDVRVDLR